MSLPKPITFEQFKEAHNRSGESVLDMAYQAQEITDDPEFVAAAKAAVDAEDRFLALMNQKGIEIG